MTSVYFFKNMYSILFLSHFGTYFFYLVFLAIQNIVGDSFIKLILLYKKMWRK